MTRLSSFVIVAALLLACTHAMPNRRAKVKAIIEEEKAELQEALATTGLTEEQLRCKDEGLAILVYLFRNRALNRPNRSNAKVAAFCNIDAAMLRPVVVEEIEEYTERRISSGFGLLKLACIETVVSARPNLSAESATDLVLGLCFK